MFWDDALRPDPLHTHRFKSAESQETSIAAEDDAQERRQSRHPEKKPPPEARTTPPGFLEFLMTGEEGKDLAFEGSNQDPEANSTSFVRLSSRNRRQTMSRGKPEAAEIPVGRLPCWHINQWRRRRGLHVHPGKSLRIHRRSTEDRRWWAKTGGRWRKMEMASGVGQVGRTEDPKLLYATQVRSASTWNINLPDIIAFNF